jgi:hypothetical protein
MGYKVINLRRVGSVPTLYFFYSITQSKIIYG